jgi:hypothetical protein
LEGSHALRNVMTVHSPPSTSLGTRRSDDVVRRIFLGSFDSSRNMMTVHSPPSTSLGTRRSGDGFMKSRYAVGLFQRISPGRFTDVTDIPRVDIGLELGALY